MDDLTRFYLSKIAENQLTKRQLIAKDFMASLISNSHAVESAIKEDYNYPDQFLARMAIKYTDTLLKLLEEK